MRSLELTLRALRDAGRKALVPYFMAGATPDWTRHVEAALVGGADAVEIGIPFSDPMMDGIVIQEAALRALQAGTTLESICAQLAEERYSAPLIAMTYYNIFLHFGLERSAGRLAECGVRGAIVPDLTLEESEDWRRACDAHDLATIFLVALHHTRPLRAPGRGHARLLLRIGAHGGHRPGPRRGRRPARGGGRPGDLGRADLRGYRYYHS